MSKPGLNSQEMLFLIRNHVRSLSCGAGLGAVQRAATHGGTCS